MRYGAKVYLRCSICRGRHSSTVQHIDRSNGKVVIGRGPDYDFIVSGERFANDSGIKCPTCGNSIRQFAQNEPGEPVKERPFVGITPVMFD